MSSHFQNQRSWHGVSLSRMQSPARHAIAASLISFRIVTAAASAAAAAAAAGLLYRNPPDIVYRHSQAGCVNRLPTFFGARLMGSNDDKSSCRKLVCSSGARARQTK